MSKLHFEHGATDGKCEDAYKQMLVENEAAMKAEADARTLAYYYDLKARLASLKNQIERMEENPVIMAHNKSEKKKK